MISKIKNYFFKLYKAQFFIRDKILPIIILLGLFFIDRVVSLTLRNAYAHYGYHGKILINNFLAISPQYNKGIAFNILADNSAATIAIEVIIFLVVLAFFICCTNKFIAFGLGLVFIGSFSNFLEHAFFFGQGAFDFVEIIFLHIVFNIADIYTFVGLFVTIFAFVFTESKIFVSSSKKSKKLLLNKNNQNKYADESPTIKS